MHAVSVLFLLRISDTDRNMRTRAGRKGQVKIIYITELNQFLSSMCAQTGDAMRYGCVCDDAVFFQRSA